MNFKNKISKQTYSCLFIRFLEQHKYCEIRLKDLIYGEQFASLAFNFHFITIQMYTYCPQLQYPKNGWISLDKEIDAHDTCLGTYDFTYKSFLSMIKLVKKKIVYDLRCLKRFENDLTNSCNTINFIENIALTNELLFKRVALRQVKRLFNQRKLMCNFKIANQPSLLKNLEDAWQVIVRHLKLFKWSGGQILNQQLDTLIQLDVRESQVKEEEDCCVAQQTNITNDICVNFQTSIVSTSTIQKQEEENNWYFFDIADLPNELDGK